MTHGRKIATILTLGTIGAFVGMTAASAGGGGHCEPTESSGTRVELSGACFTPTTLFVDPGQTIAFVNRDPIAHNVSGSGWGHYEDMDGGDRYTTSFADEGVYAYACTLHPGMTGSIVVGEAGSSASIAAVDSGPVAASALPTSEDDAWITAGAIGIAIGAAAGTGVAAVRRRAASASS
ncbi:hypothetical protein BH18ACT17_BH18ACT17_13880 [soil metagenome]